MTFWLQNWTPWFSYRAKKREDTLCGHFRLEGLFSSSVEFPFLLKTQKEVCICSSSDVSCHDNISWGRAQRQLCCFLKMAELCFCLFVFRLRSFHITCFQRTYFMQIMPQFSCKWNRSWANLCLQVSRNGFQNSLDCTGRAPCLSEQSMCTQNPCRAQK